MEELIKQIGFTGTSRMLVRFQEINLREKLLENFPNTYPLYAHHGDCIEADTFFHNLIRELFPQTIIVGHPPIKTYKRAYNKYDILME